MDKDKKYTESVGEQIRSQSAKNISSESEVSIARFLNSPGENILLLVASTLMYTGLKYSGRFTESIEIGAM
ncbi:hypothetical protein ACKKBH_08680 [Aeromonas dhakensis]|uniref:hypothetical protein n=1 Tax=Aeromonas dhakensis TaxID=196024 RepID=UPI0038F709E9